MIMQVTTKGAGLNPNAKVWQEIPAQQSESPEEMDNAPWLNTCLPPAEMTEGMFAGKKKLVPLIWYYTKTKRSHLYSVFLNKKIGSCCVASIDMYSKIIDMV